MDSILNCTLYFIYDARRDLYLDVYTDGSACQRDVDRLNEYSQRDPIFLRYAISQSSLGQLLLDLKNGKRW